MKKLFYPAIFHPEEEGGYSVFFPDLEGCYTCGDTLEQCYEMAFEVLGLYLEVYIDKGLPIPDASAPNSIELEGNDFIAIIEFDMLEYKKRTGSQAVKKTLTIPSWLNYEAEKAGINFSSTLQNAIKDQLGLR